MNKEKKGNIENKAKPDNKKNGVIAILAVTFILVMIAGGLAIGAGKKEKPAEQPKKQTEKKQKKTQDDGYITYEGKKYKYNSKLRNILFMGVDKTTEFEDQDVGRGGQSDSLILLVMNKEEKTTTLLEISRDAMTDIKAYDMNGEFIGMEHSQITLQYAYGDGKKRSCQLTKDAVSSLLYEVPIQSHLALTVEGIAIITDALGGVEVTVPEDYTWINPLFAKGATVNLKGDLAEQYVRRRDISLIGSNKERMDRQSQFLEALARKIQERGKDSKSWFLPIMPKLDNYMITDVTVNEMEELSQYEMLEPIEMVPGEIQHGEKHDEFIVDEEELQKIIIKLFYKPVE